MTTSDTQLEELLKERGYRDLFDKESTRAKGRTEGVDSLKSKSLENSIVEFQKFYHLPQTGELDEQTRTILLAPRCGVPDPVGSKSKFGRLRRWPHKNITLSITTQMPGFSELRVKELLSAACDLWTAASENLITISPIPIGGDIVVSFGNYEHEDDFPFNGPGRELAHAFWPGYRPPHLAGQIHFDMSENWSLESQCPPHKSDFLTVAIHEIGHALGLEHVGHLDSVMHSNYVGVRRQLYSYDESEIKRIYSNQSL